LPDFGKDFQTAAELGFASRGIECAAWKSTQRTFYPKFTFRDDGAFEHTKKSESQPKKLRPAKQRRKTLDP
jgi:hypothetical protein